MGVCFSKKIKNRQNLQINVSSCNFFLFLFNLSDLFSINGNCFKKHNKFRFFFNFGFYLSWLFIHNGWSRVFRNDTFDCLRRSSCSVIFICSDDVKCCTTKTVLVCRSEINSYTFRIDSFSFDITYQIFYF